MSKRQDRFEDEVDSFMQERRQRPSGRQSGQKYERMMEQTIKHMDARDLDAMFAEDGGFDDAVEEFDHRFQNRSRH